MLAVIGGHPNISFTARFLYSPCAWDLLLSNNRTIERHSVTSSWVKSVGYDADTSTLEVEFVHGAIFQYFDVPAIVHAELMAADSKGTFLNNRIRKARYRYRRIHDPQ